MSAVHLRIAALALVATAVAACSPDRAVSLDPMGDPAYGFSLQLTPTNLPRGSVAFVADTTGDPQNDSLKVTLRGLDSLENGHYTVWVGDSAATTFAAATGDLIVIRTDTVLDAFGDPVESADTTTYVGVSSFQNGGPRNTMTFVITRASAGLADTDPFGLVVVTIEDAAGATAPNFARSPLWQLRGAASMMFGHFDPDPANRYVYVPQGRGRVYVRGDIFLINDSSLTRPPQGYFLAAYAVKRDADNNIVDTLYLGPQTSPFPRRDISLRDADVQIVDPLVQTTIPPQILAASVRVDADTVAGLSGPEPYLGVSEVYVTLESKNAVDSRMGPAILLRATAPEIIRFGN
jgi:hypothetical protein